MNRFDLLVIFLILLNKNPLVDPYSQLILRKLVKMDVQWSRKLAFDSIERPFLLAVLKSFGFDPQFIHWIRTIFKNAESCVMNNGHST